MLVACLATPNAMQVARGVAGRPPSHSRPLPRIDLGFGGGLQVTYTGFGGGATGHQHRIGIEGGQQATCTELGGGRTATYI